ncbi:hypothetical protein VU01_13331, partial [Candidatus Electrothrix marina]
MFWIIVLLSRQRVGRKIFHKELRALKQRNSEGLNVDLCCFGRDDFFERLPKQHGLCVEYLLSN